MKAGLKILSDYKDSGRKIAVLSDMLELGPDSPDYHREVGEFLGTADITDLYITGTLSKKYAEAAQKKNLSLKTKWFSSNDELISYLKDYLKENDVVLIKASNGMKLYEVAKALE